MKEKRRSIGVILAGGSGLRFEHSLPKQFCKVAGREVIEHTVDVFQRHPLIDEICIVSHADYISRVEAMVIRNHWGKVKRILQGGRERYQSSLAAIRAYAAEPEAKLIFHDAVRPLLSDRILRDTILALDACDAADVAIPASDTIVRSRPNEPFIADIPDRRQLNQGQTPQGFRQRVIQRAYEIALADPAFTTTDDCGVAVRYLPESPVYIVPGDVRNIKLTHREDLYLMDRLFQIRSGEQEDAGPPVRLAGKTLVIFGGNSGIGAAMREQAARDGARVYSFSRSSTGTDISRLEDVRAALAAALEGEGVIDFVVCAAAVLKKEPFHLMSPADMHALADINYKGALNVSHAAFPALQGSRGQLLHFTSSSYTMGRPFYSLYSSSKAAVVNLVQGLSQEWSEFGIRVNCINPERTDTPMRAVNFGMEDKNTLLKAEDVAAVALRTLLSPGSGQVVDVRLR